jgi:hypothetical protein
VEPNHFSASYDSTARVITAIVIVLLASVVFATRSTVVAGFEAVLLILSYAYSPRGYSIVDRAIVVSRLIGDLRIPLDGIREVRTATADDFRGCIRLFGSGGLFGYYGLFRTSKLGKCIWYVTNRGNAVVTIGEKTAAFSPDDVDGFVAAVRASVPVTASRALPDSPRFDSLGTYSSGSLTGKLVAGAFGIAVLSLVAFVNLYSPGPPGYTLTPQALIIHDRFYPVTVNATAVDVNHIRIVDLGAGTDWEPTVRTNGFGSLHYHAGFFRANNGNTIRMYRADGRRLVLLPPTGDGMAVLLETRDPEKFMQDVRQEWSRRS